MDTTNDLRQALARLATGDDAARAELLSRTQNRLRQLISCWLHRDFARLASFEQTDDLLQDVHLRLLKGWERLIRDEAGQAIQEPAVFLSRVARLVREVLLDAVRHHYGRGNDRPQMYRYATSSDTDTPGQDPGSETHNPEALARLGDFHQAVDALPDPLKQVVDLHWYQQLPHGEVATLLGLGESTVRKYWVQARLKLIDQLGENPFQE